MIIRNGWKGAAAGIIILLAAVIMISCGADPKQEVRAGKTFWMDIAFSGGSGKAYIKSPVEVTESGGKMTAKLIWSSENYDYMIVDGVRYENENAGGESTFTVEIGNVTEPLTVIGDTTAMSTPHEIEYVITWEKKAAGTKEDAAGESLNDVSKDDISTVSEHTAESLPDGGSAGLSENKAAVKEALEASGLSYTGTCDLKYAEGFSIEKYDDYDYITISGSGDYLVVPEGREVPAGIPESVRVLQKPFDNTYLVSSSAMDLIRALGALDRIKLSGTRKSDWYVEEARQAMESGQLLYAGKYRAPDYELLLEKGCNLAIENTMIYHEPAVKSKLEELGIPVLVETSSYEKHPLGRLEWIKLYGVLYERESEAEEFFDRQLGVLETLPSGRSDTGKTVAFFYVTANGLINVRKSGDYITSMIELAGGHYVPESAGEGDHALSTMNMQMEDFYAEASGADIIVYNSTIGGEITSIEELVRKNALFRDFKAVKESNVYCTERELFQQITGMADFMRDLNDIFMGVERDYRYIKKL